MARLVFMGSKASGLAALERLVALVRDSHDFVGIIAAADERDERSVLTGLAAVAARESLPFVVARGQADARALAQWHADVAIVVGWYRMVPLANYPNTAFYGLHYSSLPRYRGSAPVVWQILQGERDIGVTLFRLDSGMDCGDIVDQASVRIEQDETIGEILPRLDAVALDLLQRRVIAVLEGTAVLRPQRHEDATYCGPRAPDDGEIDWSRPAAAVHDFIRSQSRPYPGAFTTLPDGRSVRVWRSAVDPRHWLGVPGAVVKRISGAVVVACGDGAVRVLEAQGDGDAAPQTGDHALRDAIRLGRRRR